MPAAALALKFNLSQNALCPQLNRQSKLGTCPGGRPIPSEFRICSVGMGQVFWEELFFACGLAFFFESAVLSLAFVLAFCGVTFAW